MLIHSLIKIFKILKEIYSVSINRCLLVGWLVGFYGISTFVGYLTLNPFLCK